MRNLLILLAILSLAACGSEQSDPPLQGYVEGRQLILAPRVAGIVAALTVVEGDQVKSGKLLFSVDSARPQAVLEEAVAARAAAESRLADLRKGGRAEEIQAARETLKASQATLTLAEQSFQRSKNLVESGASAVARLDQDRAVLDSARARLREARARLALIRLPARTDIIAAAERDVAARDAAIRLARADLRDYTVMAPASGRIETIFRRRGEMAGPTQPVLALLPPDQTRIRFFVHEATLPRVHHGGRVTFRCDNCPAGQQGKITYISDQAEFTPPVIFSEKERKKLVYMVEAIPDHPEKFLNGQPVGVTLQ